MPATPLQSDRRNARAARTRDAVVGALYELILEGDPRPKAADVAARAGVALRSVYVHFATQEELYRALAERATVAILALLSPIDPRQALEVRIATLCDQRARVNEEVGPVRRAAALQEPSSPELAQIRQRGRLAGRDQIERVFARELTTLEPDARRRRVAAVEALLSGEAWDQLRAGDDLSREAARTALGEALADLLGRLR